MGLIMAEIFSSSSQPVLNTQPTLGRHEFCNGGEATFLSHHHHQLTLPEHSWAGDIVSRLCKWRAEDRPSARQILNEWNRRLRETVAHEQGTIFDKLDVVGNKIDSVGNKIDVVDHKLDDILSRLDQGFAQITAHQEATINMMLNVSRADIPALIFLVPDEILQAPSKGQDMATACERWCKQKLQNVGAKQYYQLVILDEGPYLLSSSRGGSGGGGGGSKERQPIVLTAICSLKVELPGENLVKIAPYVAVVAKLASTASSILSCVPGMPTISTASLTSLAAYMETEAKKSVDKVKRGE